MRFIAVLNIFVLLSSVNVKAQDIYTSNQTFSHREAILKYNDLQKEHPEHCKLITGDLTDCGKPLHLFVINKEGKFNPPELDRSKQTVMFILNAIHPGEPCGVDASIRISRELLRNPKTIPNNVVICIIPMYNIGGATNRNCCSRANQNGPEEYGFRGNAQNLDLNRDFIKADSRNAFAFIRFYRDWDPDLLVDTHTSNGADYQHVMTLITTQTDKLNPILSNYVVNDLRPFLFESMKAQKFPMAPYVHTRTGTPESGIVDYLETPRYSSGYVATFNTIAFVSEAHMLKPYAERVEATYLFIKTLFGYANDHSKEIIELRKKARALTKTTSAFEFNYELDTTRADSIEFLGYAAMYRPSLISGLERLYYDHDQPFKKIIPYFRYFNSTLEIKKPKYYVVPQAWLKVVDRLRANKIEMLALESDTTLTVFAYKIINLNTIDHPFEGHYLHTKVEVEKSQITVNLYRGDYLIKMGSENDQFIMEVLEPQCVDSYFAWNFFDAILQQKEWFSSYVFEDVASDLLENDDQLRILFNEKKQSDPGFAENAWAQLYFIYTHSDYYEPTHNRYPIYRIE